jgi:hypothetical protein
MSKLQFYRIQGKFHNLADFRRFLYQILNWVMFLVLAGKLSSTVSHRGPSLDHFSSFST